MIDKWNLGCDPTGFDQCLILQGQMNYYNPNIIAKDGMQIENGYVTKIITDKSIQWINEVINSGKPFNILKLKRHKKTSF